MEPLNKQERTIALRNFIISYAFIVILFLAISYLLFYVPSYILGQENKRLTGIIDEQSNLLVGMDTMGARLKMLEKIDKSLLSTADDLEKGALLKQAQTYENDLQLLMASTRKDSSALLADISRRTAKDIIQTVDAFLTYRNTIALLRQYNADKGQQGQLIEQLNSQLRDSKNELLNAQSKLENCQMMLTVKNTTSPANNPPSGGGGGGGQSSEQAKRVVELEKQIESYEAKIKELQQKSTTPPVVVTSAKEAEKIDELQIKLAFAEAYCAESKADERINKCEQRKSLYRDALTIFRKYQNSPKPEIKQMALQKINDLTKKLQKGCE
jgi:hypothetical protein